MATSRLSLYNEALAVHIGHTPLGVPGGLSENNPARFALDYAWDADFVDTCLQAGQWNFATRTVRLDFSPSITPDFGFQYAFEKPEDFIRITGIYLDADFDVPLTDYFDEAGYWWSDVEPIYVRYVSNDAQYGGDFSLWPKNFSRFVACDLAVRSCLRVGGGEDKKKSLQDDRRKLLREAKATDAMEEPSRRPPAGDWTTARRSGGRQRDRGSRTQLIG